MLFQTTDPEMWTFVNLNLAMVYLRMNRNDEFIAVLNSVEPERVNIMSVFPITILIFLNIVNVLLLIYHVTNLIPGLLFLYSYISGFYLNSFIS